MMSSALEVGEARGGGPWCVETQHNSMVWSQQLYLMDRYNGEIPQSDLTQ